MFERKKHFKKNPATAFCGDCIHFCNDPETLEKEFPGLGIMSSGFASVRAEDGLCRLRGVYLSCRDGCADFRAVA